MTATKRHEATEQPLRLHFQDARKVLVEGDQEDRFVTTVREAVRACRLAEDGAAKAEQFQAEFKEFLGHVNAWCIRHADKIIRAYVAPGMHGMEVFVVTNGDAFMFDFEAQVTALDLELVDAFPNWPAHVMQLPGEPDESLESFFTPRRALQVYGQRAGASPQG